MSGKRLRIRFRSLVGTPEEVSEQFSKIEGSLAVDTNGNPWTSAPAVFPNGEVFLLVRVWEDSDGE